MDAASSSNNGSKVDFNKKDQHKVDNVVSVVIELLEVALNMILYVRNIYPDGIFKKYRKYNIAVLMSCHPEVNSYIKDVFASIQPLISKGDIEKVVFQIINKDGCPVERYCFEMKFLGDNSKCCYFDVEEHVRALLLKLNVCESLLSPLPAECSFQILAHTKRSTLTAMEESNNFQDSPWVVAEDKGGGVLEDANIIPIRSCSNQAFILQCYAEENTKLKGLT